MGIALPTEWNRGVPQGFGRRHRNRNFAVKRDDPEGGEGAQEGHRKKQSQPPHPLINQTPKGCGTPLSIGGSGACHPPVTLQMPSEGKPSSSFLDLKITCKSPVVFRLVQYSPPRTGTGLRMSDRIAAPSWISLRSRTVARGLLV